MKMSGMGIYGLCTIVFAFTFSAYAMQEAFDKALEVGTKEAIEQCVTQHSIDLNKKNNNLTITFSREPKACYPLEYVIHRYMGMGFKDKLLKLTGILMILGVPIDGYDDYNPLLHFLGTKKDDLLYAFLQLGASPNKEVPAYYSYSINPLQEVTQGIQARAHDYQESGRLKDIQKWMLNPPPVDEKLKKVVAHEQARRQLEGMKDKLDAVAERLWWVEVKRYAILAGIVTAVVGVPTLIYYICRGRDNKKDDEQVVSEDEDKNTSNADANKDQEMQEELA